MVERRPFSHLGGDDHGWLQTRHHFSFADYHDPSRMHWGQLRVLNDDTIAPATGFSAHPHRDMEIITYVREGAITHRDNLGNKGRTQAGHVQVMTAGTGIVHEEKNDEAVPTKIFQIWLLPRASGLAPRWGTRQFPRHPAERSLTQLASGRNKHPQALDLNADADLYGGTLSQGQALEHAVDRNRWIYVVVAVGKVDVNGVTASAGDGIAIHQENALCIEAREDSEILLVDAAALA